MNTPVDEEYETPHVTLTWVISAAIVVACFVLAAVWGAL
jgi:hypothetical protein